MSDTIFFKEKLHHSFITENLFFDLDFHIRKELKNMEYQHFHPYYEIFIFLDGECNFIVNGSSYRLNTYDFVLIDRYQLHKSNYLSKKNKRLLLSFNKDYLSFAFNSQLQWILTIFQKPIPVLRFNNPEKRVIIDLINEFYTYSRKKDPAMEIMYQNTLLKLLYTIKKYIDNNVYTNEDIEKDTITKKIEDLTIYIHNHYCDKITLNSLSEKFFISPHYLSRKFKEYTHFSVTEYIQLTRVKKSCHLLLETNYKIIKIAELCGFGSLSQFNRVFAEKVGMSPTKYRNQTKHDIFSLS
ncbi:AraC family transcriptional regulator [Vallitalea okinawensis]|uniref:AraC family transcriptional regulator n=1 Tax=Vallitalea okinawensis TaxID=2078660 RepID=UPI000CFBD407|nr:AraC family transcriptional regulator [Vallitalea okinawensis]